MSMISQFQSSQKLAPMQAKPRVLGGATARKKSVSRVV